MRVMKKLKKRPFIKDERIEKLDGKVAGELVLGIFLLVSISVLRSEERRVGKECRSRWSPYH